MTKTYVSFREIHRWWGICSGPLSGVSGPAPLSSCTALSLSRSPALSRSRSPALFPAPLREVSAALWSAERSLDLNSSILAVTLNKPRSYPRLFYKVNCVRVTFRSRGTSRFEWLSPLQPRRFPPHQQQTAEAQRSSPPTPPVSRRRLPRHSTSATGTSLPPDVRFGP